MAYGLGIEWEDIKLNKLMTFLNIILEIERTIYLNQTNFIYGFICLKLVS